MSGKLSSLAVFPAPGVQDTITVTEYNSNFFTAENPRESQPCLYTFGQVQIIFYYDVKHFICIISAQSE